MSEIRTILIYIYNALLKQKLSAVENLNSYKYKTKLSEMKQIKKIESRSFRVISTNFFVSIYFAQRIR